MEKRNKREIHQTGMTEERKLALEKLRNQKRSGKSQLEQMIEVSAIIFIQNFFISKGR
jgi:hypothetical protein